MRLHESETDYRTLAEHLTELVYRAHPVTLAVTFVNPAVQVIYGYSVADWLSNPDLWVNSIHPDDRERVLETFVEAQRLGTDALVEYRVVHKDGSVRWVIDRFGWERDANGDVVSLVGVMSDVTAQKQAEEARRESDRKLAAIVETLPGFLYRCANTPDWTMEFISQGVFELTGYRAEEFMNGTVVTRQVIHREDSERVWHDVQAGLRSDGRYQLEYRLIHRNGTVRWAWERGMGVYDAQRILLALEGVVLDITQRKHAEEAVREREARLTRILETIPGGVILADVSGTITYANPAAVRLVGATPDGVAGRRYNDPGWRFIAPDGRAVPDEERLFNRVLRTGQAIYDAEMSVRLPDGRVAVLSISAAPIRGADGTTISIVGAFNDITDRKRANDVLKDSEARFRESAETLRILSARMNTVREEEGLRIARELHDELGQALTSLKMDLFWLDGQLAAAPEDRRLAALREKSASILQLVDSSVQTVRRIAADLRPPLIDDLGFTAAVEWQAQEFQKRSGIACSVAALAGDSTVEPSRATALYRILQEALTNVARHSGATRVDIVLAQDAGSVVLDVRDNGRGITAAAAASPRSIGLLGMQERARVFGGDVRITRAEPRGTRVMATIPLA